MPRQPYPLAYLVSAYPATSHTFILREVTSLRARGWAVTTISINRDTRAAHTLDADEQAAQRDTWVVKDWPRVRLLPDLFSACWRFGPRVLLATLAFALRLARPGLRGHLMALAYWLEAALLAGWLARRGINHLHVHFGNEAALVGLLVKRISGCTLSYTIHGPDEFQDARGQQLAAKVAAADCIVCISHFARSQLMLFSAPQDWVKLQVIRLGVDAAYGLPASLPAESLRLLCVGRLCPAKGQHLLLHAVARLRRAGIKLSLLMVGNGPTELSLRAEVGQLGLDCVHFAGALGREAVRHSYSQADVFVLPSFAEGVPVVLMEAMASGLPCVSTRVAGIPELLIDNQTGLLVPPGDEDALFEALWRLASSPDLRSRLGAHARAWVREHYAFERNLDQLAGCLLAIGREGKHA
ncbi:colanic acid biosynthesis glycosyltransferase WcaL [Aquitalea sp. S1-19]|nr:colanic acid biosynthesis glycosyltransferase WcaL [Aquitalea sp. S1-19]